LSTVVTSKLEWNTLLEVYGIEESLVEKYCYGEYYKTVIYDEEIVFFKCQGRKTSSSGAVQYMIDRFNLKKVI
jgi:hypothetical protein